MPSIQFQLDAPLARVEAHVRATYGTAARVVSVREIRTGGVGGFFARRALDVVVDVPDAGTAPGPAAVSVAAASPVGVGMPSGAPVSGLAGLLADADAGDGIGPSAPAHAPTLPPDFGVPPEHPTRRSMRAAEAAARAEPANPGSAPRADPPAISTQSRRFAEVLGSVQAEIAPPKPPAPETIRIAPALSRLAGDLVVLAGLGSDAATVADAIAVARGPYLRGVGGELTVAGTRADDRRGAIGLRAAGVERGLPALVSFGLGSGGPSLRTAVDALRSLSPDQVWVVVDVSRKPEDTLRWVTAVRAAVAVDAMAVIAGAYTVSASTAATLGLPEGWSDAAG